jgi:hypothetical protein
MVFLFQPEANGRIILERDRIEMIFKQNQAGTAATLCAALAGWLWVLRAPLKAAAELTPDYQRFDGESSAGHL